MGYLLLVRPFRLDFFQIKAGAVFLGTVLCVSVLFIEHNRYRLFVPIQRPKPHTSTKATVVFIKQGAELCSFEQVCVVKVPEQVTYPVQPCETPCGIKDGIEILAELFLCVVCDDPIFLFLVEHLFSIRKADTVTEGIGHPLRGEPVKEVAGNLVVC